MIIKTDLPSNGIKWASVRFSRASYLCFYIHTFCQLFQFLVPWNSSRTERSKVAPHLPSLFSPFFISFLRHMFHNAPVICRHFCSAFTFIHIIMNECARDMNSVMCSSYSYTSHSLLFPYQYVKTWFTDGTWEYGLIMII